MSKFIIDYDIVRGETIEELVAAVREKINEAGWQPHGNVVHNPRGYIQPLIRNAGENAPPPSRRGRTTP